MFTQKKAAESISNGLRKLHSIHVLPNGREFTGEIVSGGSTYSFTFSPTSASIMDRKLVLTGSVKVKSPRGGQRSVDKIDARLLGTQGSILSPPQPPRTLDSSLKRPTTASHDLLPITDAVGDLASVGMMYFKLSSIDGKALGVPYDLRSVQLNARLFPTSEVERDLHWLYSMLIELIDRDGADTKSTNGYLNAINKIIQT